MRFPEIKVHILGKSTIDRDATKAWISEFKGCESYEFPEGNDSELLPFVAGKNCYCAFSAESNPNVTKVRSDLAEYFDNILKSGHGSVLEHMSYTFAFENVSRVFTGELNRHRAGCAISERSMRYVRFTDLPFWMPISLREDANDSDEVSKKKQVTRIMVQNLGAEIERVYGELVRLWDMDNPENKFGYKKTITSMMRRILPMGTCTGGVWTFNIRALRHILALRSSPEAEEEIAYVFGLVGKMMHELEPNLFGDFKLVDGFWVPEYNKV